MLEPKILYCINDCELVSSCQTWQTEKALAVGDFVGDEVKVRLLNYNFIQGTLKLIQREWADSTEFSLEGRVY